MLLIGRQLQWDINAVPQVISLLPQGTRIASGDKSTAEGYNNRATGTNSVAMGYDNGTTGTNSVSIGVNNNYKKSTISGDGGWNASATTTGTSSTAIGVSNTTTGDYSIAGGYNNTASAADSTALGQNSTASAANAVALGNTATASADNSIALGSNATAGTANSVALGSGSVTGTVHTDSAAQSITLKGTTYTFAGQASASAGTVSVGSVGNERQIQNVAAGDITATSTDAVNGSQLYAVAQSVGGDITNINNEINNLGNRVDKVGAGAAALAGLHPLDFDPDYKWDFATGYGHYDGANALAIGAFYRPNEVTMLSVGYETGNGEKMFNAGLSFKLGPGSNESRASPISKTDELEKQSQEKDEKMAGMQKQIDYLMSKIQ